MNRYAVSAFFALAFVAVASAMPASAQATRTWVSGLGDDANPCSRTAPCKTFPGAYSRTAVGGEIDVIDPGGYGTINIGHAITIDGGGMFASILSAGTNGILINAGPSDVVTLRHLWVNGVLGYISPGLEGIKFNSGLFLLLQNDVFENNSQHAVNMTTAATAYLSITDCILQYSNQGALNVTTSSGVANATISGTSLIASAYGVQSGPNASVSATRTTAMGNGDAGFLVQGPNGFLEVNSSIASGSNSVGIHAKLNGKVWYADTMITNNVTGIVTDAGGTTTSFLNNRLIQNGMDGVPSATMMQN